MKKKLFMLAVPFGLTLFASWAPEAEAVASCTDKYCVTQPSSAPCACPTGSAHPFQRVTCGTSYICDF